MIETPGYFLKTAQDSIVKQGKSCVETIQRNRSPV